MKLARCGVGLGLGLLLCLAVTGQSVTTGAISGKVLDPTGASVPGATVTATNAATGAVHTASSQVNGSYLLPLLEPGNYTITVAHAGFQTAKQGPIAVAVAGNTGLNFNLTVGQSSQTVEVTGQAPLLQPENPNTTTSLDTKAIENLPNPGSDLTFMGQVAPGAVITHNGGYQVAIYNGLTNTGTNYTVDGGDYNDPYLNVNTSGPTNLSLGANDIAEVSVNTNSFSVDQGRSMGSQVNYVSKSGSNQYHGNASYQWNGRVLNAYDTFVKMQPVTPTSPLPSKPFDNVNNYAGSIGGPIMHNKLFWFVDDEGARIDLPEVRNFSLPSPASITYAEQQMALGGCETSVNYFVSTGATPATGNCATSVAAYPSLGNGNYLSLPPATGAGAPGGVDELPFLKQELALFKNVNGGNGVQLTPVAALGCALLANGAQDPSFSPLLAAGQKAGDANLLPNDTGCTNIGTFTGTNLSWENKLVVRGDWDPSQNNTMWFNYMNDRGLQATSLSPINPVFNVDSFQPEWSSAADWTHVISPSLVNDLTVNTSWYAAPFELANLAAANAATPEELTTPWGRLGGSRAPSGRNVNEYGLIDNVTWTQGSHQWKFGTNFRRALISDYGLASAPTPNVSASSFAELDYGVSPSGGMGFPVSDDQPVRTIALDLYGGDTWQMTSNLTLIYGLRATHNSNYGDPQGFLGNPTDFEVMTHSLSASPASVIAGSKQLWNSTPSEIWQPRLAFSYQPWTNTIVKGGYGLFSQVAAASVIDNLMRNQPFDPSFTAGYGQGNQGAVPPNQGANGCTFQINGGGAICGDYYNPALANSVTAAAVAADQAYQAGFAGQKPSCAAFTTPQPTGACIPVAGLTIMPAGGLPPLYAEEWNVGAQRQIGRNLSLDVSYVGNRALHLNYTIDPNAYQTMCAGCFAPFLFSAAGAAGDPDPRFSSVTQERYNGYSTYNALQTGFTVRNIHGLSLNMNYAWEHGLSTGAPFGDLSSVAYTYRDTGSLPFHNLSANYTYALPFRSSNSLLGGVINGWQISGATFAQSGTPIFPTGASVGARVFQSSGPTQAAYIVTGVSPYSKNVPAPKATAGVYQWLNPSAFVSEFDAQTRKCIDPATLVDAAANTPAVCQFANTEGATYFGPGFQWTNFDLAKTFQVRENLQFRFDAQAFNLFNHPNYSNPNTTAPTPGQPSTFTNAGTINSLTNPAAGLLGNFLGGDSAPRMIAFQGKLIF